MPWFRTHTYQPGGPDRVGHPETRTACGMKVQGLAMRRRRHFVDEPHRRRCSTCVAKILLEEIRR